jgi:hypothetical protein
LGLSLCLGTGWAAREEKDVQIPAEMEEKSDEAVGIRSESVTIKPEPGFRMPEGPGRLLPREGFRLRIWTDRKEYRDGERVRIYFRVTRDAYVYLFDRDTRGGSRQIFPNYFDRENYLRAGVTYSIPTEDYDLVVEGPPGREELDAVAVLTRERWDWRSYDRFDRHQPFPARPEGHAGLMRSLREAGEVGEEAETERLDGTQRPRTLKPQPVEETQGIRIVPKPYPTPSARWRRPTRLLRSCVPGFFRWSHEDEGRLRISCDPEGARVYVDDSYQGTAPVACEVKVGMRSIRVEKEGYHPEVRRVRVEESDAPQALHFQLEPKVYRYER